MFAVVFLVLLVLSACDGDPSKSVSSFDSEDVFSCKVTIGETSVSQKLSVLDYERVEQSLVMDGLQAEVRLTSLISENNKVDVDSLCKSVKKNFKNGNFDRVEYSCKNNKLAFSGFFSKKYVPGLDSVRRSMEEKCMSYQKYFLKNGTLDVDVHALFVHGEEDDRLSSAKTSSSSRAASSSSSSKSKRGSMLEKIAIEKNSDAEILGKE